MAAGALFSLSLNLGPLLCGAFICIFFFGIICMQTVNYLKTFPNDMLAMKCTVIFLWTVQLGYTICICHGTYTMTVTDFGEVFALLFTPWGLNAAVVLGSIIDHGVQCFFVVRIFRVTGALYLSLFLWIMVALLLTLSLVVAVEAIRTDSIPIMESKYHWPLLLLFYGDAAMDLVNAAVLCFYLAVQRRSAMSTRTAAIVDQLVVYTLQTGLSTSMVALGAAVSFTIASHAYIWTAFFMAMPGSFMSALLANINNRKNLAQSNRRPTPLSSSATASGNNFHGAIQISRSVVFSRDDMDTASPAKTEVVELDKMAPRVYDLEAQAV